MDIISVQSVTKEYKQYKRFKGFWGSFRSLVRVMFGCAEIIRIFLHDPDIRCVHHHID